jgi:CelD/BcsL family acetyltransferase involved in cellulose biosynthesis
MRDNLAYYPRLLKRHGHDYEIEAPTTTRAIEGALDALIGLHNARAISGIGKTHVSHMPSETHERFIRDSISDLASRNMAFVRIVRIDGEPAAAQAFLEFGGRVVVYYSGFAERWAPYSPLTILLANVIEELCARGVRSLNFLPGFEQWKTRWRAEPLTVHELSLYRVAPDSLLRIGLRELVHWNRRRMAQLN